MVSEGQKIKLAKVLGMLNALQYCADLKLGQAIAEAGELVEELFEELNKEDE